MTTADKSVAELFVKFSREKLLGQYWPRLRSTVEQLTDEQVWWRPNEASNSIGNLILHLNGNMYQWTVASFNRLEDKRARPEEFAAEGGLTTAQLLEKLGATIDEAGKVLERLTADDLLAPFHIQGHDVHGLDAIYQVIEHFGLHYGQILYAAKILGEKDLGFYKHLNKTGFPE
jgi:hypothetical protein